MAQRTVSREARSAREALLGQEGNNKAFARYNKMDEETKLALLALKYSEFIKFVAKYNGPDATRPNESTHSHCIGAVYEHGSRISGIR